MKALLQRKLAHAFSKEELDRLKQKGVYKEAEHDKLEAERLLVTRQVRGAGGELHAMCMDRSCLGYFCWVLEYYLHDRILVSTCVPQGTIIN